MRTEDQTRYISAVVVAAVFAGFFGAGLRQAKRHFDARLEQRKQEMVEAVRKEVLDRPRDPSGAPLAVQVDAELPPGENALAQLVWWLNSHQAVLATLLAVAVYLAVVWLWPKK